MNDSHDTVVKSRRTVYAKPELKGDKSPVVKKQHTSAAQETSNDVIDNEILEQQENQLKEHAIADTAAAAVLFDHAKRHQSQSSHNASSRKRSFSTSVEDNTALSAAAAVAAAAAVEDVSAYNNTVATAAAAVSNDDGSTTSATSAPVSVRTTSSAPVSVHPSQQQQQQQQQSTQQQQHQPQQHQQPPQQPQQPQVILHNQLSATVGPKPPVGSPEWHRQRRDNHKEVERRRRENINEGIHTLSQIVPNCDKNKGQILQRAAEYIRQLKETEATLIQKYTIEKLLNEQSIAELSNTNEKLKKELAQAWEEVKIWKKKAGEH